MKHGMTDQGNAAPRASRGTDGALPSKGAASTIRGGQQAPRASNAKDGNGFADSGTMSGPGGPNHGKTFAGKFATSAMSQAVRRRQKASTYP